MRLHIDFHLCSDHFNQLELKQKYASNLLHIVSAACFGKSNFAVGFSLEHAHRPSDWRKEGQAIADKANQAQTPQTLLPLLPQTVLPMYPGYVDSTRSDKPTAEFIRNRCLTVFAFHFDWISKRLEKGEVIEEMPALFFNLDQEGNFPVRQTIQVLRELAKDTRVIEQCFQTSLLNKEVENLSFEDRHELINRTDRLSPFFEVRYTSCP